MPGTLKDKKERNAGYTPRAGGINSRPAQVSDLQRQFFLCGGAGCILYPRYAAYLGARGGL